MLNTAFNRDQVEMAIKCLLFAQVQNLLPPLHYYNMLCKYSIRGNAVTSQNIDLATFLEKIFGQNSTLA